STAKMDFYYSPLSAASRAIQMTAQALGLELNLKVIDLGKQEQLKPEFIKINPQHTIPTLVDNGFSLWESRAILVYLVEKYAKDDSLYPKDPQGRALVNQRLYFDMGTLYKALGDYYYAPFQKKEQTPENLQKAEAALDFLNTFLEGKTYLAGDRLTIADIAILATVSTFTVLSLDLSKYPNIIRWYENGKKEAPGWEINEKGLKATLEVIATLPK
ncbi:hypothetical protein KR222_011532, partial [Zaprionus bogoriensis]